MAEAEAALGAVELERGDAEVGHDAVRTLLARLVQNPGYFPEIPVGGAEARAETRQTLRGESDCLAVAVDSQNACVGRGFEDRFAVPAKTERSVHEEPPALRGKQPYTLK